jgi:hypothetical protein
MSTVPQDPFAQAATFLTGGLVAAKWPTIGFVVEGTVKDARMQQQRDFDDNEPLFWNDGSPRMQLVIDLQSEATGRTWRGLKNTETAVPNDTGMRALYVKGNLQRAFSQALRDAQAKFEKGAHIRIERIADVPNPDPKKQDALDFRVVYTPAAENSAPADQFLSQPEQAPAAPAPQYQAPAAPVAPQGPFSGAPASTGVPAGPPF